ncbi:MAG: hypothetical protein IJ518_02285 [Clostridia bacterium]|nr:hypothetical protein [Clostridia bacterium]
MVKRIQWWQILLVFVAIILIVCVGGILRVTLATSGTAYYHKGDTEISIKLSQSDVNALRESLAVDNYRVVGFGTGFARCGFTENCYVRFGGLTFMMGKDDCPSVHIKELNLTYSITREGNDALRSLLTQYGFSFPYGYDTE